MHLARPINSLRKIIYKMKTALYFGSFNPLHAGHAAIARWLLTQGGIERLVLVVSPKNPLKQRASNASPQKRLEQAIKSAKRLSQESALAGKIIEVSDIEFYMDEPLYTIKTLRKIREAEPQNSHILLIGSDNLEIIEKWNSWEELLSEFEVWVYPRRSNDVASDPAALCKKYGVKLIDAPYLDISSTIIREMERQGKNADSLKF
jgi:nicotinate-nucleotide adenylyltransferase